MADDQLMSQDEIERLLSQATKGAGASPAPAPAAPNPAAAESQKTLGQDDIEKLLSQSQAVTATAAPAPARPAAKAPEPARELPPVAAPPSSSDDGLMPQGDIEYLLNQAEQALKSIQSPSPAPTGVASFRLQEFLGAPPSSENTTLDLIRDVELDLKIELGRTHMYLEDVLKLRKGSVVPLDKLAGDPVDIYVNGRLVARGEVLVLNDNFCVRVAELIAGAPAA